MARKFAKVAKNASGTPLKYLEGLSPSEKKAKEAEMKRTAKKAKAGTLTKAEMDRISKQREARGMKKGGAAKKVLAHRLALKNTPSHQGCLPAS